MHEEDSTIWRTLEQAEQACRARDLADLRSGTRSAVEINKANRIVPDGGRIIWPDDLSGLDLEWDLEPDPEVP